MQGRGEANRNVQKYSRCAGCASIHLELYGAGIGHSKADATEFDELDIRSAILMVEWNAMTAAQPRLGQPGARWLYWREHIYDF